MILDARTICSKMDSDLAIFIHNIITIIKIAVPVILVLFGMLDFGKGVIAGKEDEIKKGQGNFIKRLIAGAIVFLMITISQLVISVIDKESAGEFWNCANKIMNGTIDKELTTEEKQEELNRTIEQCCILVDGEVMRNIKDDGTETVSCKTTTDNNEKYNQCYNEKK